MRSKRFLTIAAASVAVAFGLTACGSSDSSDTAESGSAGSGEYPITIEHALGTVTLDEKPERVATVNWANHEVPLALGVVPVGMAAANFGDDDGNGMLPWVEERLEELGAETPVLFDETDGIDFEAVSDTNPDVILAAYSGLTQEDYETLSEIAPVVAYPEAPWATSWRDMIELNSAGLGMAEEGKELVASLEQEISDAAAAHPELEGKATMFLTHVDTADLSQVSFYTANDTRAAFFEDLGLATPKSVADASTDDAFSKKVSAEQVDVFDDVQIIVTYGDQELVDALEADPLLSQMPAVRNGSIVFLDGSGPLGTAANPTPLAISWVLSDYVQLLSDAAAKTNAE
ncbi:MULTISPECIES: iron-siderophore ABC transporter substrate-binding protein [Rhodococcus]|uniref:Iron-siderophore ABC transporter substrate-binding protein n=1 Tax=Rhodococcus pyridinivorans AK37 TaxID=1114960 RepID=H0JT73_9NOCA|nr:MULTISPECIES: iron-siderophore ABC transporter substrate-binding protein [Rhodococcus]KLL95752.1 ABC transporter substrate-binding protein [Rhodococcus sp. IITR03]EHK82750.1 iron-siderophore ABC transporter substrate-binding protein [Rhodococcus pyridinivorans AK37]MBF4481112.1 iron-siderophore ABC transporter substrate-binding protein [Rhodococcus rhodochrous]MCD2141063.1 iron-siderophore ABC transporter substrate-binding protein [Rhodococcus pyridinivorans]MCR8693820.1 iron-siderophore AB